MSASELGQESSSASVSRRRRSSSISPTRMRKGRCSVSPESSLDYALFSRFDLSAEASDAAVSLRDLARITKLMTQKLLPRLSRS